MEQNPSSEPKEPLAPETASSGGPSQETQASSAAPPATPVMPPSLPIAAPPVSTPPPPTFDPKDVERHKFVAALSYLGILVFVPLLLKRDSAFARMHSAQGVLLLVTWMIALFFIWIPLVGWLIGVALVLTQLFALISCLQGRFWEAPIVGVHRKKLQLD